MKNKTFENENFTVTNLELETKSLTENDPQVEQVILTVDNEQVGEITHNPRKQKEEKAPKTDQVSGIQFGNSKTTKQVPKNLSEIPEALKKIQAGLNEYGSVEVSGDVSRWTRDNGDSGFYLSEDQAEELDVDVEDPTEYEEDSEEESEDGSEEENPF